MFIYISVLLFKLTASPFKPGAPGIPGIPGPPYVFIHIAHDNNNDCGIHKYFIPSIHEVQYHRALQVVQQHPSNKNNNSLIMMQNLLC